MTNQKPHCPEHKSSDKVVMFNVPLGHGKPVTYACTECWITFYKDEDGYYVHDLVEEQKVRVLRVHDTE